MNKGNFKKTRKQLSEWALLFCLINIAIVIAISQRYILPIQLPSSSLAWFYYITLSIGHFSFLLFLSYCFVIFPTLIIFPHKKSILAINVILITIIISVLIIDTFIFSQYKFHISGFVIKLLFDTGSQVINFSAEMWVTALIAFTLIFIGELYLAKTLWQHRNRLVSIIKPKRFISIMIGLYFISHFIHIYADANYDQSVTSLSRYYPLLNPATSKKSMIKYGLAGTMQESEFNNVNNSGNLKYPISKLTFTGEPSKLNILYIVIDSWRHDAMNKDITPNIYKFGQENLNYANHFSGANDTRTGIFSLFYSLPGTYWHSIESNQVPPVIMQTVIEASYETAIYASAPLINPEFNRTVFKPVKNLETSTAGKTAYERDEKIVNKWTNFISKRSKQNLQQPFFGFLFFDSVHAYQYPPDYPRHFTPTLSEINYFKLNNDTDQLPVKNFYYNITHYVDSLVGKIIDQLKKKELLKNTVVIITGDHGQELNDSKLNYWGHNSNFSEYQTKVPFIMHWPEKEPEVIKPTTSHYDLTPTIMKHVFNAVSDTKTYSIGRDLFQKDLQSVESIIMTNFSMIAIQDMKNNSIMVKNHAGTVDYYGKDYRKTELRPSSQSLKEAFNDMGRFYK